MEYSWTTPAELWLTGNNHYFWTFGQRSKQLITPGVDNTCRALTHLSVPSLFYQFLQKIMFKLWWSLDGQHLHSCDPLMISWTHLSPISEHLALIPHLVRNAMVSNTGCCTLKALQVYSLGFWTRKARRSWLPTWSILSLSSCPQFRYSAGRQQ